MTLSHVDLPDKLFAFFILGIWKVARSLKMQHNPHHAMNGRHPSDNASTTSHTYDDYPASHSGPPLFNNNHPPNQHHQQQPQSHLPPPNQWSQGMQMNGQHQPMPQHQSPFNQPPWGNQMPISSFPNNVNAMPGFNMNFIPQQVLQEAYALSVAVSASDEPTLVSKLLSCRKRGVSYKEALNSLHAVLFSFFFRCVVTNKKYR